MAAAEEEGMSPFERLRQENIRRNAEMLRSLGLDLGVFTTPLHRRVSTAVVARDSGPGKRKRKTTKAPVAVGSRRSLRIMGIQAKIDEKGAKLVDSSDLIKGEIKIRPNPKRHRTSSNNERPKPAADSCRNMNIVLKELDESHLGKPVGRLKRDLVSVCVGNPHKYVRFSKYSGILEWKNAIVLTVNIYGDAYKNIFLEKGRQITWFAQARQTEDTPVINRMIPTDEPNQKKITDNLEQPVLLFCRGEGEEYVYCGRLRYLGHDASRLPLRFVWKLKDYDRIIGMKHDDSENKSPFSHLINESERLVKELYGEV